MMGRFKTLVLLVVGLVLLTIIQEGETSGAKSTVRIAGLSGISGLAMVKLIPEPKIGSWPVSHSILKSPDLLAGKIISGEVDLAALPINTAAILYNKGASIQVAAVIGWGVMYLIGDAELENWAELKGKEILVPAKGAVPDLLLRYLLIQNGIDPEKDLSIRYVGSPVELAQLSASGAASLALLPEPWVTEVVERNPKIKVLLDLQKEWRNMEKLAQTYPQTCIVINKKFASYALEFTDLYLKELDQAIQWLNRNPEQAGILAERYVQVSASAIRKGLPRCNLSFKTAGESREEIERFLLRLLEIEPNAIGGKLPDEKIYY